LSTAIVIVSGLPRSGTSLAMQMLGAGGMPLLCDGVRPPDASNPRGYFEWEPARRLPREPASIAAARGRAVKVISALLPSLPPGERYLVLWLERDLAEVDASQRRMLDRPDEEPLVDALAAHVARTRAWLDTRQLEPLVVEHRLALAEPLATARRMAAFLAPALAGLGVTLDPARMAAAVEPALHRERRQEATSLRA
jgi:hypothetical protein